MLCKIVSGTIRGTGTLQESDVPGLSSRQDFQLCQMSLTGLLSTALVLGLEGDT